MPQLIANKGICRGREIVQRSLNIFITRSQYRQSVDGYRSYINTTDLEVEHQIILIFTCTFLNLVKSKGTSSVQKSI